MSMDKLKYTAPQQQPMQQQGVPMAQQPAGARKYVGEVATGYDAKRVEAPKWKAEQIAIENIIDELPEGSEVLDVPVGTGRFIEAYERNNHKVTLVDLSPDMLKEAHSKVTKPDLFTFGQGPIGGLDEFMDEDSVDVAIMCRLTRWLSVEERTEAIRQLTRVARDAIVFTARVDEHPHAYTYEAIKEDLGSDWAITHDWSCDGPYYCVIRAIPVEEM